MRLGSANTYDNALANLTSRQADLSLQQEKLTAGKKVVRASDDPTGAAQAERALTRQARIVSEERALELQRNAIGLAESTLGDAGAAMQSLRDLVISAGNGGYNSGNRTSLALQMRGLRDQLFTLANRSDTNGNPLFGGLGSASAPFTDAASGVTFNGVAGQRSSSEVAVPGAMDGQAVWMNVPSGNGTFSVGLGAGNGGNAWTDVGQVITPGAVTGHNYSINFTITAGITTYDVVDSTTATTIAAAQPFQDGQAIGFDGLSLRVNGKPASGDTVQVTPSSSTNVFAIIDAAISGIEAANGSHVMTQATTRALAQMDASMERLQAARGQAGDWLNRADKISDNQNSRTIQLQADQSRAEDLDMVKGISDFQKFQTGYQAALQSYAQVQKLSLFNFIN